MRKLVLTLLVPLAAMACGEDPLRDRERHADDRDPTLATITDVPSSLTCVSDATRSEDGSLVVTRAEIVIADSATVTLRRGPQFLVHGGVWHGEGDVVPVTREANIVVAETLLLDGGPGLQIELARQGSFLLGTLRVDSESTSCTCWNWDEVYGSPWTGDPGAFVARLDWTTGTCLDGAGVPAVNALPIAFVQETGSAECADLRGVALNGEDDGNPDLWGWNLSGAELDGATLLFAQITDAALYAAKMGGLIMGYAVVEGTIGFIQLSGDDPAGVELPTDATCEVSNSGWTGTRVRCVN